MNARTKSTRSLLALILAAGEGTRMKSVRPKVLHEIGYRPLIAHVLATASGAGASRLAVVVGPDRDDVRAVVLASEPQAQLRVQSERRGTAHAVLAARDVLAEGYDDLLVLFGDTPLVTPETLARLRSLLADGAAIAVLGFEPPDPAGYGRLLMDEDGLAAIREHKDAGEAERMVRLCNGGLMAVDGRLALDLLLAVRPDNAQNEFYLTDLVAIARARGLRCAVLVAPESEVMGVNDRVQLAAAEAVLQGRLRRAAMEGGATLIAPDTVFLAMDTQLAPDVLIEPHVVFGPGVRVESGAVIHAFSHLEGAHVGRGATIGPFARLRPGTRLAEKAKIGNFVEMKNADIRAGAKINHLTYVGDAEIGADANIGAGTITCNYDGFSKFRTVIGEGAFIGSNTALVAPVTIGAGAYIGSGSVITKDVPGGALAVARGRQSVHDEWATRFRASRAKERKD